MISLAQSTRQTLDMLLGETKEEFPIVLYPFGEGGDRQRNPELRI